MSDTRPRLARDGGTPVRSKMLPYARQSIDKDDVARVVAALESEWLTTGPEIGQFEREIAEVAGVGDAVAVSSGTAGLHTVMNAIGLVPGDEVIVPATTFVATANAVVHAGATPAFADVEPDTLLVDAKSVRARMSDRTKAIVAVDFAGQPCDYQSLRALAEERGLLLVADAAHSLGATSGHGPAAALPDAAVFSFHPVKHVTTAEGGAVATSNPSIASYARRFRNHGLDRDHARRSAEGSWRYSMVDLGLNYRLSDIQCALGRSQLRHLPRWLARRREIAQRYDEVLSGELPARPLAVRSGVEHAYHLYVIRLDLERLSEDRDAVFAALRAEGIGVNVHYAPAHLHPYYRREFGTSEGLCPVAETAERDLLSLPMFSAMSNQDVDDVVAALFKVLGALE